MQTSSPDPKENPAKPDRLAAAMKGIGRPTVMTERVCDIILERMTEGESLNAICRDPELPCKTTVRRCLTKNPDFAARYAVAREALVEHWADEIIDISDDGTTDYITKTGRNGTEYEAVDQEHIQRSRLRVDSRKWLMSKLLPKKYGDKIDVEHSGDVSHTVTIASLSDREKMRRLALFMLEDESAGSLIEGEAVAVQTSTDSPPTP